MEIRHLRYFVASVEEGNITRAAARLHVTQPGVSAQLRQLEHELGQQLLVRMPRGLRLTAAGEAFLPYARAALEATASGVSSVNAVAGLVTGHLTIGTISTISSTTIDMPGLLGEFHTAHPGIDITLYEATSTKLQTDASAGLADVALIGMGMAPLSEGVDTLELAREELVAVTGETLARANSSVSLAELTSQPLIVPRTGTGLRDRLDAAFSDAGLLPRIAFESDDPEFLLRLAMTGLGRAIVPKSVVTRHRGRDVTVAAITPRIEGTIGLAWSKYRPLSPAANAFFAHVREAFDLTAD